MPRRHGTAGTMPSANDRRHGKMYQETVATRQRPFLIDPGNYLHAGMIPYISALETMIRNPKLGIRKAGARLPSLGNSIGKLDSR